VHFATFHQGIFLQNQGFSVVVSSSNGHYSHEYPGAISSNHVRKGEGMQTLTLQAIRNEYPDVYPRIVEKLNQHYCSRCGGMMVEETCMDIFSDYEGFQFKAQHCIQCGELIDPFILLNRLKAQSGDSIRKPTSLPKCNGR
jgi:ribosomal protein S27AE